MSEKSIRMNLKPKSKQVTEQPSHCKNSAMKTGIGIQYILFKTGCIGYITYCYCKPPFINVYSYI